jgi:Enoyl-(Acyl carrier protein) reductase
MGCSQVRQAGQQDAEQGRQVLALAGGEPGQQGFLVAQEFVDAALDQRVAGRGERDVAQPPVGGRPLSAHQALALGAGDSLGDRSRADQGQLGDSAGRETVWRAGAAQGGQQVSPGLTLGSEFFRDRLTGARRERLVAETRTGRAGTTADVAAVVIFLASPAAGHLTGQVIHVNGGAYLGR